MRPKPPTNDFFTVSHCPERIHFGGQRSKWEENAEIASIREIRTVIEYYCADIFQVDLPSTSVTDWTWRKVDGGGGGGVWVCHAQAIVDCRPAPGFCGETDPSVDWGLWAGTWVAP